MNEWEIDEWMLDAEMDFRGSGCWTQRYRSPVELNHSVHFKQSKQQLFFWGGQGSSASNRCRVGFVRGFFSKEGSILRIYWEIFSGQIMCDQFIRPRPQSCPLRLLLQGSSIIHYQCTRLQQRSRRWSWDHLKNDNDKIIRTVIWTAPNQIKQILE